MIVVRVPNLRRGGCNGVPETWQGNLGKIAQIHARQGAALATIRSTLSNHAEKKGAKGPGK